MARMVRLTKTGIGQQPVLLNPDRVAYVTPYGPDLTAVHFSATEKDYIVVKEALDDVESELNSALKVRSA